MASTRKDIPLKIPAAPIESNLEVKVQDNPIEALLREAIKAYLVPSDVMQFSFEDKGRHNSLSITKIFKILFDSIVYSWDFLTDITKKSMLDALTEYLNPKNAERFASQTYPPALFPQSFIDFLDRLEPAQKRELSWHWLKLTWNLTYPCEWANPGETRVFPTNLTAIIKTVIKAIEPDKITDFVTEISPEISIMADDNMVGSGDTYTTKNDAYENYKIRRKIIKELFNQFSSDARAHCLKFYEVCDKITIWKDDLTVREPQEKKDEGNEILKKSEAELVSFVKQIPDPALYVKTNLGGAFSIFRRHTNNLNFRYVAAVKDKLSKELLEIPPELNEMMASYLRLR